jgi:hypothetical protein
LADLVEDVGWISGTGIFSTQSNWYKTQAHRTPTCGVRALCHSLVERVPEEDLSSALELLAGFFREISQRALVDDFGWESSTASPAATASAISALLASATRLRSLPEVDQFEDIGE